MEGKSKKTRNWKKYLKIFLSLGLIYIFLVPGMVVYLGRKNVYTSLDKVPDTPVTIVFGAGVLSNQEPTDILRDRLQVAADLYHNGTTQKILVSGDNRYENYNEPDAMFKYLNEKEGIPEEDIVRDYAGRRTYDTCKRVREIWDVEEAILITQGYHLPRAMFTCSSMGMQTRSLSSTNQEYLGELRYKLRELIAIHKAVLDVYLIHPSYIGGEKEDDLQEFN